MFTTDTTAEKIIYVSVIDSLQSWAIAHMDSKETLMSCMMVCMGSCKSMVDGGVNNSTFQEFVLGFGFFDH